MKYILHIARIVVGNLFIFSGIVKANDPLGFSYKLEEYFIEFGMNWHWLEEILVPLAAGLCILEIILGVAVLLGYKMKEVSWVLLLMIVFFTILTGASAIFEIVRSCGCFGDAIPLTPWQSFYKDLILMAFILLLFYKRAEIEPFERAKVDSLYFAVSALIMLALSFMLEWSAPLLFTVATLGIALVGKLLFGKKSAAIGVLASLFGSIWFSIFAVEHLPFKDFRPYAIGKNIPDQMILPEGAQPPVYENVLVYKNNRTGEEKEFTSEEYTKAKIWENKEWEWLSTESTLIKEGDTPKITDFSITNTDNEDYTDVFLGKEKVLFIVAYDLSKTETSNLEKVKLLAKEAKKQGVEVVGLSAAGAEEKATFSKKYDLNFDFWVTDGIVLKTIVRSNPGLVYVEKGTVKGKWHENDVPEFDQL